MNLNVQCTNTYLPNIQLLTLICIITQYSNVCTFYYFCFKQFNQNTFSVRSVLYYILIIYYTYQTYIFKFVNTIFQFNNYIAIKLDNLLYVGISSWINDFSLLSSTIKLYYFKIDWNTKRKLALTAFVKHIASSKKVYDFNGKKNLPSQWLYNTTTDILS